MTPHPHDPDEALGVCNPAGSIAPDGTMILFPRAVGADGRSRILRAALVRDAAGDPVGVRRLGVALAPSDASVEDPRVTWLEGPGCWVMAHTQLTPSGPRVALAASHDLAAWQPLGPVHSADGERVLPLDVVDNKNGVVVGARVTAPDGQPAYALLHRPMPSPRLAGGSRVREGIWVSYTPAAEVDAEIGALTRVGQHRLLATGNEAWEERIGAGPPPLWCGDGWLLLYHGVRGLGGAAGGIRYAIGAMRLDARTLTPRWRTRAPLLSASAADRSAEGKQVLFPTALAAHPNRGVEVFLGLADERVGWARLHLNAQPG